MTDADEERWLPISGYESRYEVSDYGRVRSLPRTRVNRLGVKSFYPKRLRRPTPNPDGYLLVGLYDELAQRSFAVHLLVLVAFRGERPDGLEARHLDGNCQNNRLCNLAWGTKTENSLDKVRHGTHNFARRTACPRGHLLVDPNLMAAERRRGHRSCLACSRARTSVRNALRLGHVPPDFNAEADKRYSKIMASIAEDTGTH